MENINISLVGLGYVGLPLAVAFAEKGEKVIGFDINKEKINLYKQGIDPTNEIGNEELKKIDNIIYTYDEEDLKKANFHIIAVPTPITEGKMPDLKPVIGASEIVGRNLCNGSYVVYESTVYPGVTEEICIPILERESGLKAGVDFKVGYSPERINPGDRVNTVKNIIKVVSGMDEESLRVIANVYEKVIEVGVHKAPSIKVAEAAKVIENSQRDINIAFMNELSIVFEKMNIDTKSVLEAAGTKWNFLKFTPGLVGGHCIGVDPYYFIYKAEQLGYHSQIILSGRRINEQMGKFIANKTIKKMIQSNIPIKNSKILIMGLTFKENCPDLRNSKVIDVIQELREYGIEVIVTDPLADKKEAINEYGIELIEFEKVSNVQAIIVAVAHKEYQTIELNYFKKFYQESIDKPVLIDVKGIYDKKCAEELYNYYRL